MASWTDEEIKAVIDSLIQRCTMDAEFRELALADAGVAVSALAGRELPRGFTVSVVEPRGAKLPGADITVVLPAFRGIELDAADLELLSGGAGKPGPRSAPSRSVFDPVFVYVGLALFGMVALIRFATAWFE